MHLCWGPNWCYTPAPMPRGGILAATLKKSAGTLHFTGLRNYTTANGLTVARYFVLGSDHSIIWGCWETFWKNNLALLLAEKKVFGPVCMLKKFYCFDMLPKTHLSDRQRGRNSCLPSMTIKKIWPSILCDKKVWLQLLCEKKNSSFNIKWKKIIWKRVFHLPPPIMKYSSRFLTRPHCQPLTLKQYGGQSPA